MNPWKFAHKKHIWYILHHHATAWIILGISIVFTWIGWHISTQYVEKRAAERFAFEVEDATQRIMKRMLSYEQVLRGSIAFLNTLYIPTANRKPHLATRAEWRSYVAGLQLQNAFPGIQGVGLSLMLTPDALAEHINGVQTTDFPNYRVWPEGKRDIYSAIVYLEPLDRRNLRALGYDMFSEPMRRAAMERARDTGEPAISGKVTLVQEIERGVQAGFLVYLPFYAYGMPQDTVAQRRSALLGYVYSPFRMNDLMTGILGAGNYELGFDIYDNTTVHTPEHLLYQTHKHTNIAATGAVRTKLTTIELPGRTWNAIFYSRPAFDATVSSSLPMLIAIGGFLVDILLFIITFSIANEHHRVQAKAEAMTIDLMHTNQQLKAAKSTAENIATDLLHVTERLELAQSSAGIGIWEYNPHNHTFIWDQVTFRLYGLDPDKFIATLETWKHCIHSDDLQRVIASLQQAIDNVGQLQTKFRIIRSDGATRYLQAHAIVIIDTAGIATRVLGVNFDITEQQLATNSLKKQQLELELMAYYDPLTKLPNRVMLGYELELAVLRVSTNKQLLAVCYLDLDGFKPINDKYGHDVGDQLLVQVGNRLNRYLRPGDFVARIGGDEFVLLLEDLQDLPHCESVLTKLLTRLAAPYTVAGNNVEISASTGVSLFPFDYAKPETLLHHADQAMYQSKKSGRNRFKFFDYVSDRQVLAYENHLAQVETALAAGELLLHYQPKVNMRLGTVLGAEALIRWQHPSKGILQPQEFLPKSEQTEFDIHLGNWVLDAALRQLAHWQTQKFVTTVSVNISAQHLQQESFVGHLKDLLQKYPTVLPEQLELEVLETTALKDLERASRVINACRNLGVSVAIDDFGTGYSSLIYLKRLPADILKIDQSFVRDMLGHPEDIAIIEGIIGLSHAVHRKVIAEGVESEAHGVELLRLGCDLGQGYCIARPMPAETFPNWAKSYKQCTAWAGAITTVLSSDRNLTALH